MRRRPECQTVRRQTFCKRKNKVPLKCEFLRWREIFDAFAENFLKLPLLFFGNGILMQRCVTCVYTCDFYAVTCGRDIWMLL